MEKIDKEELLRYIDECFDNISDKNDILEIIAMDDNSKLIFNPIVRFNQIVISSTFFIQMIQLKVQLGIVN